MRWDVPRKVPMVVGAQDVRLTSRWCHDILEPHVERDWRVKAGSLDWDCRTTVGHIADALGFYAAHLGVRAKKWLKFDVVPHADALNLHLVRLVEAMGEVLAQVIEAAPDDVLAFHHSGMRDKESIAAMGCLEILVHTGDVAEGLGIEIEAPAERCRRVVEQLFAEAPRDLDAWDVLWWATGRGDLPGRERLGADWMEYWLSSHGEVAHDDR